MSEIINTALVIIGTPVLRSVLGWLENAFEDSKISKFEWKQLGATIIRVGTIAAAGYFGLDSANVDTGAGPVVAGTLLFDYLIKALKKKRNQE